MGEDGIQESVLLAHDSCGLDKFREHRWPRLF